MIKGVDIKLDNDGKINGQLVALALQLLARNSGQDITASQDGKTLSVTIPAR